MAHLHRIVGGESSLISIIEDQARWRSQKAEEYPEDERNVNSAVALGELTEWIQQHLDSPVVVALNEALDRVYALPDDHLSFPEPGIHQRLSRHGFDGRPSPSRGFRSWSATSPTTWTQRGPVARRHTS